MSSVIEFDEGKAAAMQQQLTTCMGKVNGSLNDMGAEVAKIKSWWQGGSEDGFIDNFNKTKNTIQDSLTECANVYKKTVQEITDIKKQAEIRRKNQLGG